MSGLSIFTQCQLAIKCKRGRQLKRPELVKESARCSKSIDNVSSQSQKAMREADINSGFFYRFRTLRLLVMALNGRIADRPVLWRSGAFFAQPLRVLGSGIEFHRGFEQLEFAVFGGVGGA